MAKSPSPRWRGSALSAGAGRGYAQRAREKALRATYGLPDHQYQGITNPSGEQSEDPADDPAAQDSSEDSTQQ